MEAASAPYLFLIAMPHALSGRRRKTHEPAEIDLLSFRQSVCPGRS